MIKYFFKLRKKIPSELDSGNEMGMCMHENINMKASAFLKLEFFSINYKNTGKKIFKILPMNYISLWFSSDKTAKTLYTNLAKLVWESFSTAFEATNEDQTNPVAIFSNIK